MKDNFQIGEKRSHSFVVSYDDLAHFDAGLVHEVCSTYKLTKEMEWAGRLFVLEMKEDHEEGIGTMIELKHLGPAFEGDEVVFVATYKGFREKELICEMEARVGERLIATGSTGQKIIEKEKIERLFRSTYSGE